MGTIIGFIIRLVGYALLVGAPSRVGQFFWERAGLDQLDLLRPAHDLMTTVVLVVPFVLALVGFGLLRRPAIFVALFIAGAALTAPFAFARLSPAPG